jgi:CHAT domain-containing protein
MRRQVYIWAVELILVAAAILLCHGEPPGLGGRLQFPALRPQYRSIAAGTTHTYLIGLDAGQYAGVVVDQRDINLSLSVSGPGLELPALDGSDWGHEAVSIVAKSAGLFRIQVIAAKDDSARGRYKIVVAELRKARTEDDARMQAHSAFARAHELDFETPEHRARKESLLREAVAEWRIPGDALHQAQALNRLGRLAQRSGRFAEAQRNFEAALVFWNQLDDAPGRLETLKLIANLGAYFGQDRAPIPVLEQYLHAWQRIGDRRAEAILVSSIATNLRSRAGDLDRAISYEERALRLREALGNRRAIADSLDQLAENDTCYGRLDQALLYAERALRMYRDIGNPQAVAAALDRLGAVLERLGRYDEMARGLQESLAIRKAEGDLAAETALYTTLSREEKRRGNLAESLAWATKALEIDHRLSSGITNPVSNWAFQNLSGSQTAYISALLALHTKTPDAAYGAQAFLAADRGRGRYIVPESGDVELSELQQSLDSDTTLVEYMAFSDATTVAWVVMRNGIRVVPIPGGAEIEPLARRATDLLSKRAKLTQGDQPNDSVAADVAYQTVAARLSRVLLTPLRAAFSARRILVVADETFAFLPFAPLPDPNRADGAPLIADHEIVHLASATAAVALRKEHRRRPDQLLAVIADPVFDVRDRRAGGAASTETPLLEPDLAKATRSIGLSRDGADIPRLPFAAEEAAAIGSLVPGQHTMLVGFDASRTEVLKSMNRYRVMHFATHGFTNFEEPELSGLVFSLVDRKGAPREGFLRLRDIYNLKVSADLVALAACQTALGRLSLGYGVIGLTGAFLHAGAARVLSTAWTVDDEATAALMTAFYRGLLVEHLSPSLALREAQLAIASNPRWRSPYYWAGVLLYGDWGLIWHSN